MVKYKPRGLFSEFYGISAKASDVSTKPNSSEKPVKGSVRVSWTKRMYYIAKTESRVEKVQ